MSVEECSTDMTDQKFDPAFVFHIFIIYTTNILDSDTLYNNSQNFIILLTYYHYYFVFAFSFATFKERTDLFLKIENYHGMGNF